VGFLLSSRTHH